MRWHGVVLRWLPAPIIVAIAGAAVGLTVSSTGPVAPATTVEDRLAVAPAPAVPVLSPRRHLGLLSEAVASRRLHHELAEYVRTLPPDSCLVVEVDHVRFEHRGDDPQAPASAQKLLVAVAALELLGPDHVFETVVEAAAPPVDGVVDGDLFLVGGGDPLLSTPAYAARFDGPPQLFSDLGALADAVVAAGVTVVDGAVVGVDDRYDTVRHHPAWPRRFILQDQTGPLSALAVNDGFSSWPASGLAPVVQAGDPAELAASVFRALLIDRGVRVTGGAVSGPWTASAPVARHASPPVRDIVGQMLRHSDNATAELLVKELGVVTAGAGTFGAGTEAIAEVVSGVGAGTGAFRVVDGSGLAEENAVTCDFLVDLLDHETTADAIRAGLAVAGESGTLRTRWRDSALAGRVRAKTGTLRQVSSLVGVVETRTGSEARFALVVNVAGTARVETRTIADQERLLLALHRYPSTPDLAVFGP